MFRFVPSLLEERTLPALRERPICPRCLARGAPSRCTVSDQGSYESFLPRTGYEATDFLNLIAICN